MQQKASGVRRLTPRAVLASLILILLGVSNVLLAPVGIAAGVTAADIKEVVVTGRRIPC